METLMTVLLAALAIFILVKNIKNKASGNGCDCGSCSSHCSMYKKDDEKDNEK